MHSPICGSLSRITANEFASKTWSEAELRALISDVITSTLTPTSPKTDKKTTDFHTTREIAGLISRHINTLREQFGADPFVPAVLRHALKQLTTLRVGDSIILSDGYPRWDTQVLDSMKTSPFIAKVKTGWYRLLTEQEMTGQGALPLED